MRSFAVFKDRIEACAGVGMVDSGPHACTDGIRIMGCKIDDGRVLIPTDRLAIQFAMQGKHGFHLKNLRVGLIDMRVIDDDAIPLFFVHRLYDRRSEHDDEGIVRLALGSEAAVSYTRLGV